MIGALTALVRHGNQPVRSQFPLFKSVYDEVPPSGSLVSGKRVFADAIAVRLASTNLSAASVPTPYDPLFPR